MADDRGSLDRRAFLALCGATALAGCTSPGSSVGDDGSGSGGTTDEGTTTSSTTTDPTTTDATSTTTTETTPDPGRITTGGETWRMHGAGPTNSGAVPTAGPVADPSREWALDIEGIYTVASPAAADDRCFTASGGYAYGADVADGGQAWRTDLDYPGHHYSPAIYDDVVYVAARTMEGARNGGGEGTLYALSVEDGSQEWRFDRPVSSPPTVATGPTDDTTLYVTSSAGTGVVHALNPRDGSERWSFEVAPESGRARAFGAPAMDGATVYVTTTVDEGSTKRGALYALSAVDGSVRWRHGLDVECRAAPVVVDGTAYVATTAGTVHAVDLDGQTERWTAGTDREIYTTPAVTDHSVFALAKGDVVAFDRATGDQRWRTSAGVSLINGLVVAGDTVYTGGTNLTALSTGDGSVRWQFPVPDAGGGFGSPSVVNGVVYAVICIKHSRNDPYDDELYAIR